MSVDDEKVKPIVDEIIKYVNANNTIQQMGDVFADMVARCKTERDGYLKKAVELINKVVDESAKTVYVNKNVSSFKRPNWLIQLESVSLAAPLGDNENKTVELGFEPWIGHDLKEQSEASTTFANVCDYLKQLGFSLEGNKVWTKKEFLEDIKSNDLINEGIYIYSDNKIKTLSHFLDKLETKNDKIELYLGTIYQYTKTTH